MTKQKLDKTEMKRDLICMEADLLKIRDSLLRNNVDKRFDTDLELMDDSLEKIEHILYYLIEGSE